MAIGSVLLGDVSAVEEYGAIKSMTVKKRFTVAKGIASTMLNDALAACPEKRGDIPTSFPNLRLAKRTAKIVDKTNDIVEVTLDYVSSSDYLSTTFQWKGGGGLYQTQRTTDYYGIPVTVSYTYPTDPSVAGYPFNCPEKAGLTETQGCTLALNIPTFTMTGRGIVATNTPLVWANKIKGRVNSDPWFGGGARLWICQSVEFEPHNTATSPNEYLFTVVMEFHNERWDQMAVFIADDGKPVPPPCPNAIKYVIQYPTADFNVPFPTA